MAILTGFPLNRQINPYVSITNRDFASGSDLNMTSSLPNPFIPRNTSFIVGPRKCPKFMEHLHRQNERVRAALVVYALNVMEELGLESTPQTMQDCIDVGEEMYARYRFDKHGPYGDYIQGHLKRLLQEADYYMKVVSSSFFG